MVKQRERHGVTCWSGSSARNIRKTALQVGTQAGDRRPE